MTADCLPAPGETLRLKALAAGLLLAWLLVVVLIHLWLDYRRGR